MFWQKCRARDRVLVGGESVGGGAVVGEGEEVLVFPVLRPANHQRSRRWVVSSAVVAAVVVAAAAGHEHAGMGC